MLKSRAVAVDPAWVQRVRMVDLNVTAQHMPLASGERFDLVIGTNVFVYSGRDEDGDLIIWSQKRE